MFVYVKEFSEEKLEEKPHYKIVSGKFFDRYKVLPDVINVHVNDSIGFVSVSISQCIILIDKEVHQNLLATEILRADEASDALSRSQEEIKDLELQIKEANRLLIKYINMHKGQWDLATCAYIQKHFSLEM